MQRDGLQLQDLGPEPQKGLRRGLWCFAFLALGALIAVILIERDGARTTLQEGAQRETHNLARAFAHHAARTLGESDQVLRNLADDLADASATLLGDQAALHDLLLGRLAGAPELRSLSLADASGQLIASTLSYPVDKISLAERPAFQEHRDNPDLGLRFGATGVGRIGGQAFIALSRRWSGPDGSFRGLVLAGLDPGYFGDFYQAIDLGVNSQIALLGEDGRLLVGAPPVGTPAEPLDWPLMAELRNGSTGGWVVGPGLHGEGDYLFAFRKLDRYPLVAVVGIDRALLLGTWDEGQIWRLLLIVLLGIGLLALTAALVRSIGQIYDSRRVAHSRAQALATVIDSIADGLMMIDAEGKVLLQNPKAVELFGGPTWQIGELHQPPGTRVLRIDASGPLPDDERLLARALRGESVDQKLFLVRREGDPVTSVISGSSRPIRDVQGKVIGAVALLRDVTQQRQLDERLRTAQRLEALGQLTGGVAHDFNNLLTVITGSAEELLTRNRDTAQQQTLAQMILETSERASRLTRHLLAFARQQTLAPRPLDVNEQLVGLERLLARTLGATIEIKLKLDPELWPALADSSQLETAVINLSVNGRDAMPGGGRVIISTQRTTIRPGAAGLAGEVASSRMGGAADGAAPPDAKPGDYVTICVADNGTGMLPEVARRAFDPFFTTKDVGKGTGLGLSMVYGFAQQSGGFVTLDTQPGVGTTVCLHLPRAAGLIKAASAPPASPALATGGATERILLVEDDPAVRRLVEEQLLSLGYRVTTAAEARAAVAVLAAGLPIDLMLTDLLMPNGMDGLALAEEARRLRPGLKIILATGVADHASLTERRPDPTIRILPKPFRGRQLAKLLRELLDETPQEAAAAAVAPTAGT
jgi:PAS domain S-box-containing protein